MKYQPDQTEPLTGFFKRDVFEEQFPRLLEEARDHGKPLSLAFLDIDEFKSVNDQHGQQTGDAVLKTIAGIVEKVAGESTMKVRYGGDEFLILFPDTVREQAFLLLEKIRLQVESLAKYGDGQHQVDTQITVSAGIASYPVDATTENELKRNADQALYRAKVAGRNAIRLAYEEKMAPKTNHYTLTQLERLTKLAKERSISEAILLREALDDLLIKYGVNPIES